MEVSSVLGPEGEVEIRASLYAWTKGILPTTRIVCHGSGTRSRPLPLTTTRGVKELTVDIGISSTASPAPPEISIDCQTEHDKNLSEVHLALSHR